jgi:hypothetical protein
MGADIMAFIWNNTTPNIPRLTDVLNNSSGPLDIARTLTYAWIWVFGGWFFAGIIGTLAAALYIKYQNAMVPIVFMLIMVIFYDSVLTAAPLGFPSAEIFVYLVVVLAAFSIGFLLFRLFVGKR